MRISDTLTTVIKGFLYGLRLPLSAAGLIFRTPSLLSIAMIPVLISMGLYYLGFRTLQRELLAALGAWLGSHGFHTDHGLAIVATIALNISLFLCGAFTFSIVSTLVASPFNDWLAERTERFASPPLHPAANPGFKAQLRLVLIDVSKSLACGIAGIFALVLSWVPVLNLISFTLACLLMTFQYVSYAQTRRGIRLLPGLGFLFRHFPSSFGLGVTLTLSFAIPFVGGFTLPLAVVSGTLLFAHHSRQSPHARQS